MKGSTLETPLLAILPHSNRFVNTTASILSFELNVDVFLDVYLLRIDI